MPDHGKPGSGYGAEDDQRKYLKSHSRQRNQLLRQFVKGDGGTKVASKEYQLTWIRIFGKRVGEHAGRLTEKERCNDEFCWCRSTES